MKERWVKVSSRMKGSSWKVERPQPIRGSEEERVIKRERGRREKHRHRGTQTDKQTD